MDFIGLKDLYSRAMSDEPTQQLPPTLKDSIDRLKQRSWQSNLTENYNTYIPQRTLTNILPIEGANGYVTPLFRNNIAHIADDNPSPYDTFAHEAAHVGQMQDLPNYFFSLGKKLKGIEYPFYDPENKYPPPEELLASLREKESSMKAGKRIWDEKARDKEDKTAADYVISGMKRKYPEMSTEGIKRYVDVNMFPEHSVMHESTSDFKPVPLETRNNKRGIDVASDKLNQLKSWAINYLKK